MNTVLKQKRKVSVMKNNSYTYDVALSFAGEDRAYVEEVAQILRDRSIRVFYDLFEEANLWGKNLYEYLSEIYQNKARYTVLFISKFYNQKLWTNHERMSMQARAFGESKEYILPARFDDTELPGVLKTIGYISLKHKTPAQFASLVEKKLKYDQKYARPSWSQKSTIVGAKPYIFTAKIVNHKGVPIRNAKAILMASNATYLESNSDEYGLIHFVIRTPKLYSLMIAHEEYPGILLEQVNTKEDIKVNIEKSKYAGSAIINSSGTIPGLIGSLQLVKDLKVNSYGLSADNVAIEGGAFQPYAITLNKSLQVEDSAGNKLHLTFRFLKGKIGLVDINKHKSPY